MVTRQSANQLKTSAKVTWVFKMWWFGVQCHLLVLVHFFFWKPTSLHLFTNKFWSTSCFLLLTSFLKMLFSFSSRIWHTAKSTKSWLNDHGFGVLDRPANLPDLNPIENLCGIVKRIIRNNRPKKCRWAEGHCQRNLGFHTTSAVPQTDHLHAALNWGSN